jgi:hypothetical protein
MANLILNMPRIVLGHQSSDGRRPDPCNLRRCRIANRAETPRNLKHPHMGLRCTWHHHCLFIMGVAIVIL